MVAEMVAIVMVMPLLWVNDQYEGTSNFFENAKIKNFLDV
jgi:hypothetical protein